MQLTRLAVRTDALIIVDAVGDIGILLDLGDQHACADGVQRACLDEEHIALFHRNQPHIVEQRAVLDMGAEFLLRQLAVEAVSERSALLAVHDIPALGLAVFAVLVLACVAVIGVDLHAEILLCVDQLDQHREAREIGSTLADTRRPVLLKILLERHAAVDAGGDGREPRGMAGKLPALRNAVIIAFLAELCTQLCPAPDIVLERGSEF